MGRPDFVMPARVTRRGIMVPACSIRTATTWRRSAGTIEPMAGPARKLGRTQGAWCTTAVSHSESEEIGDK
jgi:hypothetical protein